MPMKNKKRHWIGSAIPFLFLWSGALRAAERYEIHLPAFVMAGDPDVSLDVVPVPAEDGPGETVKFVGLPPGVSVEPADPSIGWVVSGPTRFRLKVTPSAAGRRLNVKVQSAAHPKIFGLAAANLEKTVHHFSFTPLGMAAPRAGVPFRFQLLALDQDGAVVSSFHDSVSLSAEWGDAHPAEISGVSFENGAARVDLVFSQGDRLRANRLTAQAVRLFDGQSEKAHGQVDLTVLPAGSP